MTLQQNYLENLSDWIEDEKAAIELIGVVGKLWFNKSVELVLFRNQLFDKSSSEILRLHQHARDFIEKPITVQETLAIANLINSLDFAPSRIDVGRLAMEWLIEKKPLTSLYNFVETKMVDFIGQDKIDLTPCDVVLYGFGRIGRLVARELVSQAGKGEQLRLRAIVTRQSSTDDLEKRADLLRYDSVQGNFHGTITTDKTTNSLVINGHSVQMIYANKPEEIDYTAYGIENALVIDNTGVWRDREGLSKHLQAKGVNKVLLTAPGKGDIPNLVHGVNHSTYSENETIFSAASCTTNAIVPVLEVINRKFGIEKGHIETIHSYTNDQNLLDNYHKKYRRGRSAPLNLVITETGADKAVSKVLPELAGKLTGNAIRVPTPTGSLAVLNLQLKEEISRESVNEAIKNAALKGNLVEQIQYSISSELVSSDIVGSSYASIFDSQATIISKDNKGTILYVWYDNEYGYTRQVLRLSKQIANVLRLRYY